LTAGIVTSLVIVALCFAGLHTIIDLRREQARRLGLTYMDGLRRGRLLAALGVAVAYFAFVAIAVAAGW